MAMVCNMINDHDPMNSDILSANFILNSFKSIIYKDIYLRLSIKVLMNYITYISPATASISIKGYEFDRLTNVFLSASNIAFPSLTAIDNFSHSHRVSAICPAFSGYDYPFYKVIDKNRLSLSIMNLSGYGYGYIDVIFYNRAGYTKLSDLDYLIDSTFLIHI